ncbi:MAG TPA: OmpA family protein [Verrucomicrobiae bacterium]
MKLNKIVFPLALALAAVMATTGCKHHPTKITQLPGQKITPITGEPTPITVPQGGQLPPEFNPNPANTGVNTKIGGGELPNNWDPTQMNQDRVKFAANIVHFAFDSAVVRDNEQANVAAVGQALQGDQNAKLLIEGHCDERGTEQYNMSLGERRALALREALAKSGVDPMRIRTISYGKDKPVDPGHDEAAWSKNRRGEFIWCTPK